MTVLEKQIKNLSEGLSTYVARLANEVSPKPVHRLRTNIRRIESLIAYAGPDLGRKQERAMDDLTGLRKRAGKVRDFDVQISLLNAIANTSTARDRRALMELLKRKRVGQAKRLSAAIRKLQDSKFFGHLQRIGEKAAITLAASQPAGAPLQRARQQLLALATEFTNHGAIKPRLLHEVRIKLKKIRYLAELGEDSPEQQRFLKEMKSVQDALGAWHDWEELADTAEKQFGDRINCPLLVEIRALFAAKYAAASASVTQLFATHSGAPRKFPRPADSTRTMAQQA